MKQILRNNSSVSQPIYQALSLVSMSSVFLIIKIVSLWAPKVSFAGGDNPADECKSFESEEMENYKQALQDLVRAVSIAHAQGKTLGDY